MYSTIFKRIIICYILLQIAYPVKAQWAGIVKWLVEEGAESERNDILKQIADIQIDTSKLNKLSNEAYKNNIVCSHVNLNDIQGSRKIYDLLETEVKAKSCSFLSKMNNIKLADLGSRSIYNKFYAYIDSLKVSYQFNSLEEILDEKLIARLKEIEIEGIKDTLLYDINRNRKIAFLLNRYPEVLQVYTNSFSTKERIAPKHLLYWGITADSHRRLFPKSYIIKGNDVKFENMNNITNIVYNNNIIGRITSESDIECENIDLLNLMPYSNKQYKIGNSLYETDKLGRVINAYAQIQQSDKRKSKLKNQLKIKNILAAKQNKTNHVAFYLIPKKYSGTSSYLNIVSIFKSKDNKKAIKSCLKHLKQELKQHGNVSFSVNLSYCNASPYPNTIKLHVAEESWTIINGVEIETNFLKEEKNEIKEKEINYIRKLLDFKDKTSNINMEPQEAALNLNKLLSGKSGNDVTLKGIIDDKYKIVMQVYTDTNNVSGSYYYVKNGSNNTLKLSGTLNSNNYMVLKEYNSEGRHTGTFEGKWSLKDYSGTFTNYKGVKMPFKLYRETKTTSSIITFNSYQNPRFNYTIAYPSFFDKRQESENGNGCKFYMDDNNYLKVSGMYNSLNETLKDKYNEYKVKSPVYCRLKNNWFVVSDYTEDGDIFYLKTVLKNNIFMTAILVFPKDEKDYYSPIIPKMFTKFPN